MNPVVASGLGDRLLRAGAAVVFAGAALMGASVSANGAPTGTDLPAMTNDPGCETFGWRHPQCAGGAWDDETASEEWGPADNGNPVLPNSPGQMDPNIDGSIAPPGTPGNL